jgi:hypothetical protein
VDEALFAEILRTAMNKEVSAAALDALLANLCVLQLKNFAGNLIPKADQANAQCVAQKQKTKKQKKRTKTQQTFEKKGNWPPRMKSAMRSAATSATSFTRRHPSSRMRSTMSLSAPSAPLATRTGLFSVAGNETEFAG